MLSVQWLREDLSLVFSSSFQGLMDLSSYIENSFLWINRDQNSEVDMLARRWPFL